MKQIHGGVEMSSRFSPEFLSRHFQTSGTGAELDLRYEIPKNRALKIISICGHGVATGAETLDMIHLSVYPVGTDPALDALLAHSPGGPLLAISVLNFVPGDHAIIPGGNVIRFRAFFSAAVQAKTLEFNIVGYLIHPPDAIL